ncbi:MAG: electron transport complex subunit RsxC, partial [Pseudomonadota bacterium]|nr:electron transport complex subunit RsxC [Pseudomonadota bacterium]
MKQGSVTSVTDNDGASPSGRLHRFHGGLVLPGHREKTASLAIRNAGIPPLLVLPLQQHIGEAAECLVRPGDRVLKGQMIAAPRGNVSAPIHASSSGTVIAVDNRPFPHPAGLSAPAIVIETDGADEWIDSGHKPADYRQQDSVALLERIRQAGIVGLGGAGFPTQVKLGSSTYHNIDLLVINGVEC